MCYKTALCCCCSPSLLQSLQGNLELSYIFQQQSNAIFGSSIYDRVLGGLQLDEWEVFASCVIIGDKLGEGAFGEVYRGIVSGDSNSPRLNAYLRYKEKPFVAVKLLKG